MSLEAIEKISQIELRTREQRNAAQAEAKQMVADAERAGLALLQQTRQQAAAEGRTLLQKAEASATERSAAITASAEAASAALRETAEKHLETAAELIMGRVVKR